MSNEQTTTTDQNAELLKQMGLDPEMLSELKKEQEAKRVEKQRKELLKEYLEKDSNSSVYKELYDKHGLKEMVEADPGILDNRTLFLRAAGLAKKDWEKKLAEEKAANEANKQKPDEKKPAEQGKLSGDGESREFKKETLDVFHPEFMDKLPKDSAQYHFFKMNQPKPNEKWR